MMSQPADLTERQAKWFASVRTGLERTSGRTLDEWVVIAKTCPEQTHRKRLGWMKEHHGLGQNHASIVFAAALPDQRGWDAPDALADALWTTAELRALRDGVQALVTRLPDVVIGQRKGFTAFSRKFQFASIRPARGGTIRLGLAIDPMSDPRLEPAKNEGWSERLASTLTILTSADINASVEVLLRQAWERS